MRQAGLVVVVTVAVAAVALGQGEDERRSEADPALYDCGTIALYNLLKIQGHPVDLTRIEAALPPPPPDGYPMKEILSTGRDFGLNLEPIHFHKQDAAPEWPMLVHLARGPHGHYLVVRPVGHTGTLLQVIDSNGVPEVIDAATLYGSPEWTGLALAPLGRSGPLAMPPLRLAVLLAVGGGLTLALWHYVQERKRGRSGAVETLGS